MKNIKKKYNINTENKFTLLEIIVITLAFSVLTSVITGFVVYKINDNNLILDSSLTDIVNTYNQIKNEFYGKMDMKEISDKAINAMMSDLGEEYSKYLDDEETSNLSEKLSGTYYGMGIQVMKENNKYVIREVFEGTPAESAGIKGKDELISIDEYEITEATKLSDLDDALKGKSTTRLGVIRDNEKLYYDIKLTVIDKEIVISKTYKINEKKIGYIDITTFSSNSSKQFKKEIEKLEERSIDSLIIDLRSNTGGYLSSANEIASMFIKKGEILYALEDKKGKKNIYDNTEESRNYDVIVLINQITASASEILATSLKDSYGAIIVGANSFGKGRVQQTKLLSDNTMIKYTTAAWYRANGDSIDGLGIEPDIETYLTSEYLKNQDDQHDAQLQKALEILTK